MLYEKKMLILSGDGKGVVLIEKSAHGVKFTLRTFDMPPCGALKAGIVTKSAVFVRDLPQKDNPAATFNIDDAELEALHFAVFDDALRLYGSTGKRMWESNLMDLLSRHEKRAPMLDGVPHSPLPPIAKQPQVLPMPDGSGIPQSRISVYGDDALAENDFYTHLDFSRRMQIVDGFLDTPRTLDELAPRVTPSGENKTAPVGIDELPVIQPASDAADDMRAYSSHDLADSELEATLSATDNMHEVEVGSVGLSDENTPTVDDGSTAELVKSEGDGVVNAEKSDSAASNELSEAAASVDYLGDEMPWETAARWIKKRGGRPVAERKARVRQVPACEKLKRLRATEFFERARRDIDILFASAARDESLSGLIDDVEWVKVDVDGNTVSVGRSGNAFLCYAVAGTYERTPPLGDEAQWLPRDRNVPTGKGYWVIFQNLATGEIIK